MKILWLAGPIKKRSQNRLLSRNSYRKYPHGHRVANSYSQPGYDGFRLNLSRFILALKLVNEAEICCISGKSRCSARGAEFMPTFESSANTTIAPSLPP